MRSITKDDDQHSIYINLHLEEVFHNLFTYKTNWSNESVENSSSVTDKETEQRACIKHKDVDQYSLFINDDKGIYQSSLSESTIKYLENTIPDVEDHSFYILMNRIEKISNNALREFVKLIKKITDKNILYLSGVESKVHGALERYYNDPYTFSDHEKSRIEIHKKTHVNHPSLEDIRYKEIWNKVLKARVMEDDCRELYNAISHSSSVMLKYYFNIKPLFNDPFFLCNAVYDLAMHLKGEFDIQFSKNNRNKCLLAMSMNGMTICSLLSQLFEVDIIRIDHLGPYNELYLSSFERFVDPRKDYYIVSDVICMGREVSDAKAVMKMFGVECKGVICFINIIPVGEKDSKTFSIIDIDKNTNRDYEYGINTDLSYTN